MVTDEMVEKAIDKAVASLIDEHPMGHWRGDQVKEVARRAIAEAALSAAEPVSSRNDEAGYVEFLNEDVPYIVRDIQGAVAILMDLETRNVIGYRVYDPNSVFAPQPAPSVAVKELEWSPRNDQPQYEVCADTPFGRYKTSNKGEYGFGWMQPRQTVWSGFLPTLEEAKAAAQADYEARIRSALSAQVQGVAGWQSMGTAPKDGTVIQAWHTVHNCPICILWNNEGHDFNGEALHWFERSYTTAWPEHAFSHWMPLPAAPAKQEG